MWILVLILFIACEVCAVLWACNDIGWRGLFPGVMLGALIFVAIVLLITLGLFIAWGCGPAVTPVEPIETIDIIALNDMYGVDGYIYYRHGSVDSELEYVYLYNVPNKGLTVGEVPADKAYLNTSNVEKPNIKVYITRPKSDFLYKMFGELDKEYKITLPNDALITDKYIIDLE